MSYWGLATLQPFGAETAMEHLARQSHEHYFPRFLERRVKRGKVSMQPAPLFPGYIFVLITDRWGSIKNTKGVASVVMTGSEPSRMRDRDIDRIRSGEVDGFVHIPDRPRSSFHSGQRVRCISPSLEHHVGIYQGDSRADRTRVLFSMFGRSVSVFVRESELVAVA